MQTETSLAPDRETTAHEYPSLLKRYQALFIDVIVTILLLFGVSAILDRMGEVPDWVRIVSFVVVWGIYEPFCIAFACTLGNYFMGLRVRSATDTSKRINILKAYIRFVLKFTLGWISFLTIHSDPRKRAMHDMAAGSVVIEIKQV